MHEPNPSESSRSEPATAPIDRLADPTDHLTDPDAIAERDGVCATSETVTHADRDHRASDLEGRAVVGVTNDANELLVLIADELGVALLPHGDVEPGGDWTQAAREGVAGQTGIDVSLESVAAVRTVDHVVDGTSTATTHRVVYGASPVGGEIRACKRSAEAGSDAFRAAWIDDLPAGIEAPEGGPRTDLLEFREP